MKRYYYIKFNKSVGDMNLMKEVLEHVKHGLYIIDFVEHLEDDLDVEIIDIDREQFDMLLNMN